MHFKVTSTVKEDARLGSKEVVVTTDSPDQELAARFTPGESTRCF
jgi:hypothetical protein